MFPYDIDTQRIIDFGAKGVILSGGPESVHADNSPRINDAVFDLGVPVLGICYGMQAMADRFGGQVHASDIHEFGAATININGSSTLIDGIEDAAGTLNVWMSHGDKVIEAPKASISSPVRQAVRLRLWPTMTSTIMVYSSIQK